MSFKLFNLSKAGTIAVLVFLALILAGIILHAKKAHSANEPTQAYVQFSAGSTIVQGAGAPVADLSVYIPNSALRGSYWEIGMMAIGESNFHGQNINNNLVWRGLFTDNIWHFRFGIGASYMTNYLPYNGGHVNANLQVEYDFQRWPVTLTFSHFSDAGSALPNYGRNIIMVGWRF
jgi:hypothetical protein